MTVVSLVMVYFQVLPGVSDEVLHDCAEKVGIALGRCPVRND